MDFAFVKEIGTRAFSAGEVAALQRDALPGSHRDFILKEALIDPACDKRGLAAAAQRVTAQGNYVLNSFPDEHFTGCNLLVRSEFLLLRHVGAGRLPLGDAEAYARATVDRLLACAPAAVIYRLCDYDRDDFGFLDPRELGGSTERGAQFLIDEPRLLQLDLTVIRALADAGIPVRVLIPFVRFPDQLAWLRERIAGFFAAGPHGAPDVGIMLEVPATLFQVECFLQADFFVPGPSDLVKYLFGGLDRNSRTYEKASDRLLLEPLERAVRALEEVGGREIFFTKNLIQLARELDLPRYRQVVFRDLFMPFQLVGGTPLPGLVEAGVLEAAAPSPGVGSLGTWSPEA